MTGNVIIDAAILLGIVGLTAAIILYFVSKVFKVIEDPRIDEIAAVLPGANCGGCGYPGCRTLAEAIVKAGSIEGIFCPVGGEKTAQKIADILGISAASAEPKIAVIRCNGSCENAPAKSFYDSTLSCAFAHSLFAGESACAYGCLGCGDCAAACKFNAIYIDKLTKLPVIVEEACVACGICVTTCPRNIIELRNRGKNGKRVYVTCRNQEKGAWAKKNCNVACIGCGKCAKACQFEAITLTNNLAYIDYTKCKLCKKCVSECPTQAITAVNFPAPKKEKIEVSTTSEE
ncbi:MAG TPA: RnfABCDGE type electron transport complex subunit B [Bacteroidales bacterium]|nr:RnfABCDGE type electron transport complex subunit B [Bacteroidales bacterium]HOF46090.1 RnfABCDGE type electron transport complex subunit B [Bacteroidales bacterium]HOS57020.1 RnfABCDGE type electron transport complex subunit B [Bacteroidales bacterium]HRT13121.1 RnfABCDGE type electron transport complex subunit B [Bacteroidales bacterium]HXK73523.1 RnfABCDGE type electron transport complex subunit B [Bacteroidales bacterium]